VCAESVSVSIIVFPPVAAQPHGEQRGIYDLVPDELLAGNLGKIDCDLRLRDGPDERE
jgi:hypothetical protein